MDVVDGDDVFGGVVAEFVGGSVAVTGFEAAAGEPHGEAGQVVVAAVPLSHRRSAELGTEDDERVFEHVALLEVGDEGRHSLIDFARRPGDVVLHRSVMVPVAMIELNEPDAAFGQSAGQQAVRGERAVASFGAVHVENVPRLVADIHQVRHAGLHAEGHFVLTDPRGNLGIAARLRSECH